MLRKAQRGLNTGGRVYGYDNVEVYTTAANGERTRSHVDYRINDTEAEAIRAIFRRYGVTWCGALMARRAIDSRAARSSDPCLTLAL
ncbi:MAG: hypothetical protein ACREXM_05570 [Gammaproteobacteria bacterium]